MLSAEGLHEAATLLRLFDVRFEETGFDNWDGGTAIWTIYILIDAPEYARVGPRRTTLEEQIAARLKPIIDQYSRDWFSVSIAPKLQMPISGWRGQDTELSALTRQNIFDGLRLEKVRWSGVLEDVEFLQRIFDLKAMPSFDTRFTDAASDIWQHRVNNDDWDDDWVFGDTRFNLLHCSSEQFVRFLAEMVHPVVRPDRNEALQIVQHINEQLKPERWHLVEEERIAGRPRFVGRRFAGTAARSVSRARTVADALDAGWMQKEIERLERSVDTDPALAIGTAKELVESCCKSILAKRNVEVSRKADLPELTKLVAKELKLVPDGISDEAKGAETVRLILRNLTALTQYLAELRGMYGSGHGRDGRHRGLEPRHARLAVGAAVAFIDFVADTHHRRLLDDTEVH